MNHSRAGRVVGSGAMVAIALAAALIGPVVGDGLAPVAAAEAPAALGASDLARKADIMHGERWQQAVAELGGWLATQSIYSPAEVRRIKVRFNERVAAMSSYDLEYLLDSISQKLDLLKTPEARDAKAWLGEYLSAMSDARRAQELRGVPDVLQMNAAQLWQEIQRIDRKRATLQERQQGVETRRTAQVDRAAASRQATASASQAAAARARSTPAHSPYRRGGGSPPFSDVPPRRMSIGVGPFGACISM